MAESTVKPEEYLLQLQLPTAVYENKNGDAVIWQAGDQMSDERFIVITKNNLQTVIDALSLCRDGGRKGE